MKLYEIEQERESEYKAGHSNYKIDQLLAKLYNSSRNDESYKLLYYWVRQGQINPAEFTELVKQYGRE